jgi:hypothetical protein
MAIKPLTVIDIPIAPASSNGLNYPRMPALANTQ